MKILPQKQLIIPFFVTLLATIAMVVAIFLPFAVATPEYSKELGDVNKFVTSSVTTNDLKSISMPEFANIYKNNTGEIFNATDGNFYIGLLYFIGVFTSASIVFIYFKKAIPVIIFTILNFLAFLFQNIDIAHRNFLTPEAYNHGAGYYLFYIASALAFAGAVWMLIIKIRLKNKSKQ